MQSLSQIKALLAQRGLVPRKRFGQNFLHDHNLIRKLVARSGIAPGDLVLEVGPGTGALTEALWELGAEVIACELDRDMAGITRERWEAWPAKSAAFTLIEGDCLDGKRALSPQIDAALAGRPFRLVANLPYGAATPLLATLASERPDCLGQFVTIQREVADRLCAKPGCGEYGPLSVIVRVFARVEQISTLPGSCFWPEPDVQSAMVAVEPLAPRPAVDPAALSTLLHSLFSKRRKQIGATLGRERTLPTGATHTMRPEELSPEQFVALLGST